MSISFNEILYNITNSNYSKSNASCYYNDKVKYKIGFLNANSPFQIISFLGILINFIFFFVSFMRLKKGGENLKISITEQFLLVISLSSIGISFGWILNVIKFKDTKIIFDNCVKCKNLGMFWLFFYIFHWLFLDFTLKRFKETLIRPLVSIMKPKLVLIKYLIITLILAGILIIISRFGDLYGISPMNTCFINSNFSVRNEDNIYKSVFYILLVIILCIPLGTFIYCVYISITTFKVLDKLHDRASKKLIAKIMWNLSSYILGCFLMFILLAFYSIKRNGKIFFMCSKIITIYMCSTPLLAGVLRILQAYLSNFRGLCRRRGSTRRKSKASSLTKTAISARENSYDVTTIGFLDFEKKQINRFISSVYISVCFCLEEAKSYNDEDIEISKETCLETVEHYITNKIINENEESKLCTDSVVEECSNLAINCIECAPKIFSYLRRIDNVELDEMIDAFLPEKNATEMKKSEGKGGGLFLSSYDKQYLLKTLSIPEVELLRSQLLEHITNYLTENTDSILCRLYGLFKIKIKKGIFGEEEINLILMRNVYGSFSNCLVCKYDLKGSKRNRITNTYNYDKDVMKDLDFLRLENGIQVPLSVAKKIREITSKDSMFLENNGLMDYSLLVVKLSFNKSEIAEIFGVNHKQKMDKEANTLFHPELADEEDTTSFVNNEDSTIKIDLEKIRFEREKIEGLKKYIFPSIYSDKAYILSIIDLFQLYRFNKIMETKIKTIIAEPLSISSVDPNNYAKRFISNINTITDPEVVFGKLSKK